MRTKSSKLHYQPLILILLSLLPILLGTLLYHYRNELHFKTLNHGQFVTPPIVIQPLSDTKHRTWKILYSPLHLCDEQCENKLYTLHQLRKAMGKDHTRISLVVMGDVSKTIKNSDDFERLSLAETELKMFQPDWHDKIYLVDPLGNLFMVYPATVNAMDILKDLKRVLEVSQIG